MWRRQQQNRFFLHHLKKYWTLLLDFQDRLVFSKCFWCSNPPGQKWWQEAHLQGSWVEWEPWGPPRSDGHQPGPTVDSAGVTGAGARGKSHFRQTEKHFSVSFELMLAGDAIFSLTSNAATYAPVCLFLRETFFSCSCLHSWICWMLMRQLTIT